MTYQNKRKVYFRLVAFLYIVILIMLCITRFMFINEFLESIGIISASDMLSPNREHIIRTELFSGYGFWDMQSNIAIFLPLGVILGLIPKKPNFIFAASVSFLSTVFIELMQYILGNGVCDVNDILFNFIGGILGYFIYYIVYLSNAKNKDKSRDFISLIALMLPPFLIVYLYDMFILIGERYSFSFLDVLYFGLYFILVHKVFLKDLKNKLIIFYYLVSAFLFLYFVFIFM